MKNWKIPTDPFSRIKYFALEIIVTLVFLVWLVRIAWHDLGF